jgi:hypothetical protein
MSSGDGIVLILLLATLLVWLWFSLKKRWTALGRRPSPNMDMDEEIPVTDAVALLEGSGYEVMTLKRKVPLTIYLDEEQELQSRLFIDHFARSGPELYVVKIAKARKPLEMTGSGIRDALLVYQLLYQEAAGVLYVDAERRQIYKIRFELES